MNSTRVVLSKGPGGKYDCGLVWYHQLIMFNDCSNPLSLFIVFCKETNTQMSCPIVHMISNKIWSTLEVRLLICLVSIWKICQFKCFGQKQFESVCWTVSVISIRVERILEVTHEPGFDIKISSPLKWFGKKNLNRFARLCFYHIK